MRVVLQRVSAARVIVGERVVGEIAHGWLALVGMAPSDTTKELTWMAEKIASLRCFPDPEGKMNRSVQDVGGAVLAVSNFTLYASCSKGRRPSFIEAARPEMAEPLYLEFLNQLRALGLPVEAGLFGADMRVELSNDGPVTLVIDTETA